MGTLSEVCGGPSSGLSLAGLKQHERDQEKESQQRSACFGHFSSTAAVYGNPERLGARRRCHGADVALRILEADDRDHAARRRRHPRPAPRDSALLQRRRRRPARSHRPVDQKGHPPHQGLGRNRARSAAESGCVRCRLPDTDGTCIRDYIQASDLVRFPSKAIAYCLREAGFALSDVQHVAVNQENLASFCQLSRESTARIAY
jgi:hypothetical protein